MTDAERDIIAQEEQDRYESQCETWKELNDIIDDILKEVSE